MRHRDECEGRCHHAAAFRARGASRRWPRAAATLGLAALALALAGCNIFGPLLFFLSPPQIDKAEYRFAPKSRIAIFIEFAEPSQENPVFRKALHEKLEQIFQRRKVGGTVVPLDEVQRLRQRNPDFEGWGLQRVCRELKADALIYLQVENLNVRTTPQYPIIEPSASIRMKVISADEPSASARVWPGSAEREGRLVQRARAFREATSPVTVDAEARKLGVDLAYLCAMPFYDVDREEPVPWEP
ncbi:MAG: hypothetical protein IPM13_06760 [Phycisphaerales bacterium]|nr:hypothetical protein [Phycisphaerales bacterium]